MIVASELGCINTTMAFDIGNACQGFVDGMNAARALVDAGAINFALVCTGEVGTRIADVTERELLEQEPTRSLFERGFVNFTFGDAGGAVVIGRTRPGSLEWVHQEYITDASQAKLCTVANLDTGGMEADTVTLQKVVAPQARQTMFRALQESQTRDQDVALWVIHQPSKAVVEFYKEWFRIERNPPALRETYPSLGNTVTGSVPIGLALDWSRLRPGNRAMIAIQGGGYSVSASILEFKE